MAGDEEQKVLELTQALSRSAKHVQALRLNEASEVTASADSSGFFWHVDDGLYLITNWHCVTGLNPMTGGPLGKLVPTHLRHSVILDKTPEADFMTPDFRDSTIALYEGEGNPTWFEHPKYGRNVDVVAVKVSILNTDALIDLPINRYNGFTDFDPSAGDDCYGVGFPSMFLTNSKHFPIWKRASIASEPQIDIKELPMLLIDTATRSGMSGSPVVYVRRGIIHARGKKEIAGDSIIGEGMAFLGVYSGRVDADTFGAQIGFVWKARVIDEILQAQQRGNNPHR